VEPSTRISSFEDEIGGWIHIEESSNGRTGSHLSHAPSLKLTYTLTVQLHKRQSDWSRSLAQQAAEVQMVFRKLADENAELRNKLEQTTRDLLEADSAQHSAQLKIQQLQLMLETQDSNQVSFRQALLSLRAR